jgi:hypothetical protein
VKRISPRNRVSFASRLKPEAAEEKAFGFGRMVWQLQTTSRIASNQIFALKFIFSVRKEYRKERQLLAEQEQRKKAVFERVCRHNWLSTLELLRAK